MKRNAYKFISFLLVVLAFSINGCDEPPLQERTNFQELIGEYLENNPDEYSTFVDVLYQSESMSFLKAYGGYTVMAPTNSAFESYFNEIGVSSVSDISQEDLQDLVKYHVIKDTLNTMTFVDGRMNTKNMFGHYLTTATSFEGGEAVLKFNREVRAKQVDIRASNGIIHAVEGVIKPRTTNAAEYLEAKEGYSIFVEALYETGLFDTLTVEGPHTVFAIPDSVYNKEGFDNFQDLREDVDPDEGDPTDVENPMHQYVAYHILDEKLKYVSDLLSDRVGETRAPQQVITIKGVGSTVLINDDTFAGVHEPGFELNRGVSDYTVLNGVIHYMKADFRIKERNPFPVYWEPTEQLEIMRMPGVYQRPGDPVALEPGQLEHVRWEGGNIYYEGRAGGSANPWVVNSDAFAIRLRPEVIPWIEFDTPVLAAGEYKVWICFRGAYAPRHPTFFVDFNDTELLNTISSSYTPLSNTPEQEGESAEEWEARGWKFYQWNPDDIGYTRTNEETGETYNILESNYIADNRVVSQLAGRIEVPTTGRHVIRFRGISGTKDLWLDMIHFIPVEEDQLWPRVNVKDGSLVTKEEIHAAYEEFISSQPEEE